MAKKKLMNKVMMEEMTWIEFDQARKMIDTILIPAGSVEVEGPHLPLGVDSFVALEVSKKVAQRTNALVAPFFLNIGYSEWHGGFPGTLSLKPSTISQILREVCTSFVDYGFKKIIFINSHVGNDSSIMEIANEISKKSGVRMAMVQIWSLVNEMGKNIPELREKKFFHAGEMMTSLMLALRPELVDVDKAVRETPKAPLNSFTSKGSWSTTFKDFSVNIYHSSSELTRSGVMGDPMAASKEKGEKILRALLDYIEDFVREFQKIPLKRGKKGRRR